MTKIEWFGQAGHFVSAKDCQFHLHTHVGGYCISTVGEYIPRGERHPEPIGGSAKVDRGRLYETMVFKLTEDGSDILGESPLEMIPYWERNAANAGHMAAVKKWGRL